MVHLNTTLFAASLLLEALLLAVLLTRRIAHGLPLFTALVAFYLLRSAALYLLFGHVAAAAYAVTYNALSLFDLILQVAVVWELFRATHPGPLSAKPSYDLLRAVAPFAFLVVLAGAVAWQLSLHLPRNPRSPIDRGVIFVSALTLAVASTAGWQRSSLAARVVLSGLAAFSTLTLLAQVQRTLAAFHRIPADFQFWSYTEPAAYLAVLLFWIAMLSSIPSASRTHWLRPRIFSHSDAGLKAVR